MPGLPRQVVVNISPQNLVDADLPARVLATLLAAELPASLLQLEITETAAMSDPLRPVKTLRQSNARGVETVIDDLGAGYTSLARLRNLPFSGIEIDRSLVVGLPAQPEDEAVAHALIDLAGSTRWCDAADARTRCRPPRPRRSSPADSRPPRPGARFPGSDTPDMRSARKRLPADPASSAMADVEQCPFRDCRHGNTSVIGISHFVRQRTRQADVQPLSAPAGKGSTRF